MIDVKEFLDDFSGSLAVWAAGVDAMDLAATVQDALAGGIKVISCNADAVATLWPWLEKTGVKIIPRFYCGAGARDADISELATKINTAFKSGADGAQVFVRFADIEKFVTQIGVIRDDLFFNKTLIIGVDINEVGPFEWSHLFDALHRVRANGLMLALTKYAGDESDFVGRVYAALSALDFDGALQFYCGDAAVPVNQAACLMAALQPQAVSRAMFFIQG